MDDLFTVDDFPYHVAPFPDTSDLYTHPSPAFHPPEDADHRQLLNPHPQKLRPIRSLDRSSSPPSLVPEIPENGWFAGASNDVGYLCHQSSQNLESLGQGVESCEELRKEAADDVAGNDWLQTETPAVLRKCHTCDPNADGFKLKEESGSSRDNDDDSSESVEEPGSGKEREKTITKFEAFLENLATKVMEKQEQMHNQLLDMIETRERERAMREESWKQKQMERIKKDEEARAQEKLNNLALISSIQNLLGHEIPIPQLAATSSREEDEEGKVNIQRDFNSDQSNNNRWPEAEVQALITLRTSSEHEFRGAGPKLSLWEEISKTMHNMGYSRSAKKCKEKWEKINKYYKKTMESRKKRRLNSKACPYFDELDILYRNQLPNIGNAALSDTSMSSKTKKE